MENAIKCCKYVQLHDSLRDGPAKIVGQPTLIRIIMANSNR